MKILSFSGFIPEQICDTKRFIQYDGERRISHFCGYASDFISQVLSDKEVDGGAFPRTCDSSRGMMSYLSECGKFLYQLHIPARRDRSAVGYLAESIRDYQKAVEEHYKVRLSDVARRAILVNERNRRLANLYEELPGISYGSYLEMIHDLLQKPLREQKVSSDLPAGSGGKRVFLVGSLLSETKIAYAIEAAGMKIVGDRLTESRRLFSAPPVRTEGDLYENIAESILKNLQSPTQDHFAEILQEDAEEIRRKKIQGVIFVTQKFCEPYDYLFPSYKKMLDGMGIPTLRLQLSDSTDRRKAEFSIEAFQDII